MAECDGTFEGVVFGAWFAEARQALADSVEIFKMEVAESMGDLNTSRDGAARDGGEREG